MSGESPAPTSTAPTNPAPTNPAPTNLAAADPAAVRRRLRRSLAATTERLGRAGVPSPSVDARALISLAARTEQPLVLLDALSEGFEADLEDLTARRERREPLQLILGQAPFRRLRITVRPGVFIPRPETELMVDLLQRDAEGPLGRVADLCTGSGAIAAALLDELPGVQVLAVDVDTAAVDLARQNTAAIDPSRVEVRQADLTDPAALEGVPVVDAVLSNPPYVPPRAVPREAEVREHDPERALYGGGEDGLEIPRSVLAHARRLLRPGGLLLMEHADVQGAAARSLAEQLGGFTRIRTEQDLTGRDRFLVARRDPGATTRK